MSDKLKPCPFCGGEASDNGEVHYANNKKPHAWWADGSPVEDAYFCNCPVCGASNQGIMGGFQTKEKAIEAWNTRLPDHLSLLVRCKPHIEWMRKYAADREGYHAREDEAELDALLSDIAAAGMK